jgi:isochorismate pyruvate lyase
MNPNIAPEACASLADIRTQIDRLDRDIVRLLAARQAYVLAAAQFKRSEAEVKAPDRIEQVVANARRIAKAEGANADIVERVYRELIDAGTDAERRVWRQR